MGESTLMAIRKKEIELQTRLLQARQTAEAMVAEAREQAAALRRAGDEAAEAEARQLRDAELDQTRREVEKIREDCRRRAEMLTSRTALLPSVVERIVAAVALFDDRTAAAPEAAECPAKPPG